MPNIPQYTSTEEIARPILTSDKAQVAFMRERQSAGEVGNAFHELGGSIINASEDFQKQQALGETTTLAAGMATAQAQLDQQLYEESQKLDPNSDDFKDFSVNFGDKYVQPALDKLGENIQTPQGRRAFDESSAKFKAQFYIKANATQHEIAGANAEANIKTTVDQLAANAHDNPETRDIQVGMLDYFGKQAIENGWDQRAARAYLQGAKGQIDLSAVRGAAEKNPDLAQKFLDAGRYSNLSPAQQDEAQNYVRAQKNAQSADIERARRNAREEAQDASEARRNDYLTAFGQSGQVRVPADAMASILADPKLTPEHKDSLLGIVKRLDEKPENELKNDPATYISLFDRIHAPDGDPKKITNEDDLNKYLGNGLSFAGFSQLRAEIQGRRTDDGLADAALKKNFVETARRLITGTNPLLNMRDPKGDENLQRFMTKFLPAYEQAQKSGAGAAKLLDMDGDFGKLIKQYQRSPAQWMRDMMDANQGNPAVPALPEPKTPAEAAKLPPGTRYRNPNGDIMVR